jgi:hypothetical protein
MVDTCRVFKLPVRCAACDSQQYETMLRIAQGTPIVCIECRNEIDLPHDNAETFGNTIAFVRSEFARRSALVNVESGGSSAIWHSL